MSKIYRVSLIALFALLFAGLANGQVNPKPEPTKPVPAVSNHAIFVENERGQKMSFRAGDLAKLKRVNVKASAHGQEGVYEGVLLVDVLTLAGVEFGEKLRGKRLAGYLLVEAADKYQVVFALAELDPGFTDKVVILADKCDGKPLPENTGNWQIVVPDEKRPGRWVRQVISLKIMHAGN